MNYDRKIWKGIVKLWQEESHCMISGSSMETMSYWYRKVNGDDVDEKILRKNLYSAVKKGVAITYRKTLFNGFPHCRCFKLKRKIQIKVKKEYEVIYNIRDPEFENCTRQITEIFKDYKSIIKYLKNNYGEQFHIVKIRKIKI